MRYPDAPRLDLVETVSGQSVADPYRWLEDPANQETVDWSALQDELVAGWLGQLPGRERLRGRLRALLPGYAGPPYVVAGRRFFLRRLPDQDHAVLLVEEEGVARVLVDPNTLAEDRTVTLDAWVPSFEGDLLAFQLSQGGDEESVLRVMDVRTGEVVDGPIDRVRYSAVAWLPGAGSLYYVRRLAPELVPPGETQFHRRVYLHRIGADPAEDTEVFGRQCDKTAYFGLETSHDGRSLAVTVSLGTAPRDDCYLGRLVGAGGTAAPQWRTVIEGCDAQSWPQFGMDGRLYILTNLAAPRRRLVVADLDAPGPSGWVDLLPEDSGGAVLDGVALAGDAVVAVRSSHAVSQLAVHDRRSGALRQQVALPGLGTAVLTGRPDEGPEVWIGYTDHVTPYRVLHLDIAAGVLDSCADPLVGDEAPVAGTIAVRQVAYPSADGTVIRMFVIGASSSGRDGAADGPRPTILYGYGGFNIALTPAYSGSIMAWVEAGGVWAIANLRGGSEEGEAWHRDGMRERKQHTFDDFHAAADWLIDNDVTTPAQLGVMGGSNGGLLVGVAITQRPDRYAAASCSAPLLDMVRYERFGLGQTWNDEYGTAADPVELSWLLGYSPYHHVVAGTAYPAVLFSVYDGDTRVDPLHARKLCAALQWATSRAPDDQPVLLRREAKVGHGARAVSRTIDLAADQLGFLAGQLGLAL